VLYFFYNHSGYSETPTQDESEKVYISFGIGVNWVLLLCYILQKLFPNDQSFFLTASIYVLHMRVCVGWTSQTYEGTGWDQVLESSLCIFCLSLGCSAELFRLLHLLSLLVGWLDCLFSFLLRALVQNFGIF
jgi:hypothetical protein